MAMSFGFSHDTQVKTPGKTWLYSSGSCTLTSHLLHGWPVPFPPWPGPCDFTGRHGVPAHAPLGPLLRCGLQSSWACWSMYLVFPLFYFVSSCNNDQHRMSSFLQSLSGHTDGHRLMASEWPTERIIHRIIEYIITWGLIALLLEMQHWNTGRDSDVT